MLSLIKSVVKATPGKTKMERHKDVFWTTVIPDYAGLFKVIGKFTGIRCMKKYLFENSFVLLIFQNDKCTAFSFNREILEKRRKRKRRRMNSQDELTEEHFK